MPKTSESAQPVMVQVVPGVSHVDAAAWDRCAGDEDPFLSHALLSAMEESGSAVAAEGWQAQHLVIEDEGGVVAVAPLYVKGHSYGEYVFDWSWAGAYRRAGRDYYPKLQCCVPFSPVGGKRLLVRPDADQAKYQQILLGAMASLVDEHELSSLHITFCDRELYDRGGEMGLLQRIGVQYHWHNRGYTSFDDFLGALLGRKRKTLKAERRKARESGVELATLRGDDIKAEHWDAFYGFYLSTIDRKWASAYLTREFFHMLGERLGERVVLIGAKSDGKLVAAALNLLGKKALFGRYWGASERHRFLHFECCYHLAIELAIELGLERVEAGAQGQHKIQRGYLPVETYSLHLLRQPGFRDAVAEFLERERPAVRQDIELLLHERPYAADRR